MKILARPIGESQWYKLDLKEGGKIGFKLSRHFPEQKTVKNCKSEGEGGRGRSIHFLKASLQLFPKSLKSNPYLYPVKILARPIGEICSDGVVLNLKCIFSRILSRNYFKFCPGGF